MIQPLAPSTVVGADYPPGGHSLQGLLPPAPVHVPGRRTLLGGAQLVVPPPQGARTDAPAVLDRAAVELSRLLGGAFSPDAAPLMSLHDALVSTEMRAQYAAPGFSLTWDRPREGFYWLAGGLDDWQVQACGEPGDLHCVSFHRPLDGPTGEQADGDLRALLAELAPALDTEGLRDITTAFYQGLFDTALSAPELRIRVGVRQTVRMDGSPAGLARILRIDAGPGCLDWPGP